MKDESVIPGEPTTSASSSPSLPAPVDRAAFQDELDKLRAREPATLPETFAWSARRTGMPETWEMGVVVLITQRSRVQIPPPLPTSEADSKQGIGLLHTSC